MIIHEFDLDMIPDNAITTVKVNQYDDDFNLKINLFSRTGGLTIQAGTEVIIRGKKPDGHVFSADCSINGNVVTVVGDQQMTAAAGRAIFELSLRKNGKELNSANFIMKVERAPMDKDTPPSNSVIRELVDALDHTDEILEAAESVEDWLSTIDDTLSQQNKAADAKKTGDEIADLKSALNNVLKETLTCFKNVAWVVDDGMNHYNALKQAASVFLTDESGFEQSDINLSPWTKGWISQAGSTDNAFTHTITYSDYGWVSSPGELKRNTEYRIRDKQRYYQRVSARIYGSDGQYLRTKAYSIMPEIYEDKYTFSFVPADDEYYIVVYMDVDSSRGVPVPSESYKYIEVDERENI